SVNVSHLPAEGTGPPLCAAHGPPAALAAPLGARIRGGGSEVPRFNDTRSGRERLPSLLFMSATVNPHSPPGRVAWRTAGTTPAVAARRRKSGPMPPMI